MGRAAGSKSGQVGYLKNRIRLMSYMVDAFDPDSAGPDDLDKLLKLLDDFEIRIRCFRDDWKEHLVKKIIKHQKSDTLCFEG